MKALKRIAPTDFIEKLVRNAEYTNMASIGCPNNFAFPGVQLNLVRTVAFEECKGIKYYIIQYSY